MKNILIIIVIAFFLSATIPAHAWPLYSKPAFRGRVVDAETKQPIEGAVVAVLYYKRPLVGGPGGPNSYVFNTKEVLTDNNGEFCFSSYSFFVLFTEDVGANFIFYKPGYMASYGPTHLKATLTEKYFSSNAIGKEAEIEVGSFDDSSYVKWKGPLGIMELKKAKTREEKWKAPLVFTDSVHLKDLPLLQNAVDKAELNLKKEGIR